MHFATCFRKPRQQCNTCLTFLILGILMPVSMSRIAHNHCKLYSLSQLSECHGLERRIEQTLEGSAQSSGTNPYSGASKTLEGLHQKDEGIL